MEEEQTKKINEAIESLFTVTNIFTSTGDEAKSEIHMIFGILLQSCGLMEMTKDEIESWIVDMKHKLDESSKVTHSLPLAHLYLNSCYSLPMNTGAYYSCKLAMPINLVLE